MRRWHRWLLAISLVTTVLSLGVAAACGEDGPPAKPPQVRPPSATLVTASGQQSAGIGSYCWSEGEQNLCSDPLGQIAPAEPITAHADEPVTFELSVEPTELGLSVWALGDGKVVQEIEGKFFAWRADTQPIFQEELPAQSPFQFTPDIPPGQYVIMLAVYAAPGSVGYGFLLEVIP